MRQRFAGVSILIIVVNVVFSNDLRIQLATLFLMVLTTLLFTASGQILLGTWLKKEKWRNQRVPPKTLLFRYYVAIPTIALALVLHSASFSKLMSDGLISFVFPAGEDITGSNVLLKIRAFLTNTIPDVMSSMSLFLAYLFGVGSIIKNMQIGLSGKLLKRIRNSEDAKYVLNLITWDQFENILRKFFESKGYKADLTKVGADGGIDIYLERNGLREMVQAKHWKTSRVGVSVVREVFGVVQAEKMHRGFIITSGLFTSEARDFANKVNGKIVLIDGNLLIEIIKGDSNFEHEKQDISGKAISLDSPECEMCGGAMVLREGKKKAFWGCSNFPECRNTHEI
ncbi:restriction endonuclease [Cronobacter turicensis]